MKLNRLSHSHKIANGNRAREMIHTGHIPHKKVTRLETIPYRFHRAFEE